MNHTEDGKRSMGARQGNESHSPITLMRGQGSHVASALDDFGVLHLRRRSQSIKNALGLVDGYFAQAPPARLALDLIHGKAGQRLPGAVDEKNPATTVQHKDRISRF